MYGVKYNSRTKTVSDLIRLATDSTAIEWFPSLSPDLKWVAYNHTKYNFHEIRLLNSSIKEITTMYPGGRFPEWIDNTRLLISNQKPWKKGIYQIDLDMSVTNPILVFEKAMTDTIKCPVTSQQNDANPICPHAKIVFDQFHVIKAFNVIIDDVRKSEYRRSADSSAYLKNSKYLLLRNPHSIKPTELPRLHAILRRNKNLAAVYLLKGYLKRLWQYKIVKSAVNFLDYWCQLPKESAIPEPKKFVRMLLRYAYGIINHCRHSISAGRLEGINNKIKVLKQRAYGYHDFGYFKLKIMQATVN